MDIYARVKYNKPEEFFEVVNDALNQKISMKNHRFLWLRNRTTDNRKCEKARNIKEKRTIEMFSTA